MDANTKLYVAKEEGELGTNAIIPTQHTASDAGYDLYSTEDIVVTASNHALVPIGLRISVDKGYWYTIHPRSSLAFKKGVLPTPGSVFDSTYTGNMDIKMLNLSDKDYTIKRGDKFAQVVIHKHNSSIVNELGFDELINKFSEDRGNDGWGSSGK